MDIRTKTSSIPAALLLLMGGCGVPVDSPAPPSGASEVALRTLKPSRPGATVAASDLAPAGSAFAIAGSAYEHRLERSRFHVGAHARTETDGPVTRVAGDYGAFAVDGVTGAALAMPSAMPMDAYPKPLTQIAEEHTRAAREYLLSAGVPAAEVSGSHVTTTMTGGMSLDGSVPWTQKLMWYASHLERSLGGVRVEHSYAYAALDTAGNAILEGVYWPAIPSSVVARARALARRLQSPGERAVYLEAVKAVAPEVGDAEGEVKIVHTSASHQGCFEARAVYSVVLPGHNRGKARILRFDDTGARVMLADEHPTGVDSIKRSH